MVIILVRGKDYGFISLEFFVKPWSEMKIAKQRESNRVNKKKKEEQKTKKG